MQDDYSDQDIKDLAVIELLKVQMQRTEEQAVHSVGADKQMHYANINALKLAMESIQILLRSVRPQHVGVPIEQVMKRLVGSTFREALAVEDLSDEDLQAIRRSKPPFEASLYDYEDQLKGMTDR